MALFAVANSGLTPVHEQRLDRHQAERIVRLLRQHIVEVACVPLLPVTWEDECTLLAVDASGGAVVVQLRQYLSAMELFSLMSRSGRYAHMSRADFVTRFNGGAAAYDDAWANFSEGLARVRGPRLVIVVVEVEEEVYPLLSNLSDGVLVVRASVYRSTEGGELLEVEPLRKALVSTSSQKISSSQKVGQGNEAREVQRVSEGHGHLSGILAGLPSSQPSSSATLSHEGPTVLPHERHSSESFGNARDSRLAVGRRGEFGEISPVDVHTTEPHAHVPSKTDVPGLSHAHERATSEEYLTRSFTSNGTNASSSITHPQDAVAQAEVRHVEISSVQAIGERRMEVETSSSEYTREDAPETHVSGAWSASVSRRRTNRHKNETEETIRQERGISSTPTSFTSSSRVGPHLPPEKTTFASPDNNLLKNGQMAPFNADDRLPRRASRRRMSEGRVASDAKMLISGTHNDVVPEDSSRASARDSRGYVEFPESSASEMDILSRVPGVGSHTHPDQGRLRAAQVTSDNGDRSKEVDKALLEKMIERDTQLRDHFTQGTSDEKRDRKNPAPRGNIGREFTLSAEDRETPTYVSIREAREARKIRKEQLLWERSAPSREETWASDSLSESSAARSSDDAVTRAAEREYLSSKARLQAIALRIQAPIVLRIESIGRPSITARLTAWGTIQVDGMTYYDPSEAAAQVTGNAALDGWTAWKALDGRTLAEL